MRRLLWTLALVGATALVLQSDGNLVLYDGAPGQNPIWATGTWNLPADRRPKG